MCLGLGKVPAVIGFDQPQKPLCRVVKQILRPLSFGRERAVEAAEQVFKCFLRVCFGVSDRAHNVKFAVFQTALSADGQGKQALLRRAHGVGGNEFGFVFADCQFAAAAWAVEMGGEAVDPVDGRAAVGAVFRGNTAFQIGLRFL